MTTQKFVADLNNRFFQGELSEPFKKQLQQLPVHRPDVFAFVERIFGFMNRAGIPATDMSLMLGGVLGTLLARILPGAWEGRVPPITIPGRHAVIDEYIKSTSRISSAENTILDVGCGFPPYTTLETARNLPDWHITGADPSFPEYLIYDTKQNYATLDKNKSTIYFQPAVPSLENWNNLLNDAGATKQRFENLLEELLKNGAIKNNAFPKLEINPVKSYETDKLSFMHGGIGQMVIEPKGVIRCFNVLFYFDDSFFENALSWFAKTTQEGGIVLIGGNWAASTECYYNVYQKQGEELINKEFAFSLDCINPMGIATWFANYDDDRQTNQLVDYIRMIRNDELLMDEFYAFNDRQREKYGLCPRDEQGYYGIADPLIDPRELWTRVGTMSQELNEAGLNQKAAESLIRAGLNAKVNEVGHVAVISD